MQPFARFRSAAKTMPRSARRSSRKRSPRRDSTARRRKRVRACCQQLVGRRPPDIPRHPSLSSPGRSRPRTANIPPRQRFRTARGSASTPTCPLSQRPGLTKNTDPDKIEADLTPARAATNQVKSALSAAIPWGRRVCFAQGPSARSAHCSTSAPSRQDSGQGRSSAYALIDGVWRIVHSHFYCPRRSF